MTMGVVRGDPRKRTSGLSALHVVSQRVEVRANNTTPSRNLFEEEKFEESVSVSSNEIKRGLNETPDEVSFRSGSRTSSSSGDNTSDDTNLYNSTIIPNGSTTRIGTDQSLQSVVKELEKLRQQVTHQDETIQFLLHQIQTKDQENKKTLIELHDVKDEMARKEVEFEKALENCKAQVYLALKICNDDAQVAEKILASLRLEKDAALSETKTVKEKIEALNQTISSFKMEEASKQVKDNDLHYEEKMKEEIMKSREVLNVALKCHEMDVLRLEKQLMDCEKEKASALQDATIAKAQITRLQEELFCQAWARDHQRRSWWQKVLSWFSVRN